MRVFAITDAARWPFDARLARLDGLQGSPDWSVSERSETTAPVAPEFDVIISYGSSAVAGNVPMLTTRPPEPGPSRWWSRLRGRRAPEALLLTEGLPRASSGRTFALPEAVDPAFFESSRSPAVDSLRVGWKTRPALKELVSGLTNRIRRFRDDVELVALSSPAPEDLATLGVWIDPAIDPDDFDGRTAEALVFGLPVVASRTPINAVRLENGRSGTLVPPGDPNEMVHAILNGLFKPELVRPRLETSILSRDRFRPEHRFQFLSHALEAVTS